MEVQFFHSFVLSSEVKRVDGYGYNQPNCLRLKGALVVVVIVGFMY